MRFFETEMRRRTINQGKVHKHLANMYEQRKLAIQEKWRKTASYKMNANERARLFM